MENTRDDGVAVHPPVNQDNCNAQWMGNVRFTAFALLSVVGLGGEVDRMVDFIQLIFAIEAAGFCQDVLFGHHKPSIYCQEEKCYCP